MQRHAGEFGLRTDAKRDPFAQKAVDKWTGFLSGFRTPLSFAEWLVKEASADFVALGCPLPSVTSGGTYSTFDRTTWAIEINAKQVKSLLVHTMSEDEVADLAGAVYHECRHAEQYFAIARVLAGEGKRKNKIVTYMTVPPAVVDAAIAKKIRRNARTAKMIATVKTWEKITVGVHGKYKGLVNTLDDEVDEVRDLVDNVTAGNAVATKASLDTKLAKFATTWKDKFRGERTRVNAMAQPTRQDRNILRRINRVLLHLRRVRKKWEALTAAPPVDAAAMLTLKPLVDALSAATFEAYQAHEHEVDARAAAEPVKAKVRAKAGP